jgi:hypothetical protein
VPERRLATRDAAHPRARQFRVSDGAALDRLAHRNAFASTEHNRLRAVHDPPAHAVFAPGRIAGQCIAVRVNAEIDVADLGHGNRRRVEATGDQHKSRNGSRDDAPTNRKCLRGKHFSMHDRTDGDSRRLSRRQQRRQRREARRGLGAGASKLVCCHPAGRGEHVQPRQHLQRRATPRLLKQPDLRGDAQRALDHRTLGLGQVTTRADRATHDVERQVGSVQSGGRTCSAQRRLGADLLGAAPQYAMTAKTVDGVTRFLDGLGDARERGNLGKRVVGRHVRRD